MRFISLRFIAFYFISFRSRAPARAERTTPMTAISDHGTPVTAADSGGCRYPGCVNRPRAKDITAPGPRPAYCEQDVPEDRGDGTVVVVKHDAMTAFRRREQLSGLPGGPDGRPVTAAVGRAAAIRDDALGAMSRLAGQLTAALDQLAAIGEQLAAAADPGAAEAQAEAIRAEAAVRTEQAQAAAAACAAARHAAELDAAEARAAAAQAIAALDEQTQARQHAQSAAREHAQALHDARAAAEDAIAAARAERDTQVAGAAAQTAAAGATITALREQLTRAETALDRERAEQHKTVSLLHDLLAARPAPSSEPLPAAGRRKPQPAPAQ
jgi:colicin import membrane protein